MKTTIKHFKEVKTKDELRVKYLELLKVHHPDKGGDVRICQEIVNEYEAFVKDFNKFFSSNENKTKFTEKQANSLDEELANLLKSIFSLSDEILDSMKIEIIGF
jgi:DNA mismatch repair ATPase MutS